MITRLIDRPRPEHQVALLQALADTTAVALENLQASTIAAASSTSGQP
ncbi:hypothetical protein [Phenylobacterium immobile]|nr:hypothetical protein [Phenylobacterium immobile]